MGIVWEKKCVCGYTVKGNGRDTFDDGTALYLVCININILVL